MPSTLSFEIFNPTAWLRRISDKNIGILEKAGAPTSGTQGDGAGKAGKGCLLIDSTNAVLYQNTNTKASPTWTIIGGGSGVALPSTDLLVGNSSGIATPRAITGDVTIGNTGVTALGNIPANATMASFKVLASPSVSSTTTTPATITGFSWTVVPGTYVFEVNLPSTMTTIGGLTVSFLLTTAVLTSIQSQSYAATASDNTTGVSTQTTATASGSKVFDSKAAAYTVVKIQGSMVVGTGGTFAWQACQNTAATGADASTILFGAYSKLIRVS